MLVRASPSDNSGLESFDVHVQMADKIEQKAFQVRNSPGIDYPTQNRNSGA
jgi:hypothetical protein